jgi:hypothetical protein
MEKQPSVTVNTLKTKNRAWGDLVRQYKPNATAEEIDFILWEHTCYPFGNEEMVRKNLKELYKK